MLKRTKTIYFTLDAKDNYVISEEPTDISFELRKMSFRDQLNLQPIGVKANRLQDDLMEANDKGDSERVEALSTEASELQEKMLQEMLKLSVAGWNLGEEYPFKPWGHKNTVENFKVLFEEVPLDMLKALQDEIGEFNGNIEQAGGELKNS